MARSALIFAAVSCLAAETHWTASNDSLEIRVNRSTGVIERLYDKAAGEDYCNQPRIGARIGGITLLDELRGTQYSDFAGLPVVLRIDSDATRLSIEKRFPGAEFMVLERFFVAGDHIRWEVSAHKTAGPARTLRVTQFVPLPLADYEAWAPIGDAPFRPKPYWPFAIDYGQADAGAVGESRWRTNIPQMVFYSQRTGRALALTSALDVPAVRVRFTNNTGAREDFHWNSRRYPLAERPYIQVTNEYLGLRDNRDLETCLLISSHAGDWRPALGWLYQKYRRFFDPDPSFDKWDGAFVMGYPMMKDALTRAEHDRYYSARRVGGAGWEELHGHFPWYGLMIPPADVKSWQCESHLVPGTTNTREKIAAHTRLTRQFGIGTFLYYNVTEAEHWYAQKEFPDSVARDEDGAPVGAYRADRYPDKRACWLMNADPASAFGKHMIRQAGEMVSAYPDAAGFFWDVYGRSYMFDFAHDDGITMVNNKPAYYPEFMYHRLMQEHVRPLLRSRGMHITANKPVTVVSAEGLDGIMASEDAPGEETPHWIAAQSYLGLNRHVMIFDHSRGGAERMYLHCLRYGLLPNVNDDRPKEALELAARYQPFLDRLRGKRWIFHPRALELPPHTGGNIFRLRDGSVMATAVSTWRLLRRAEGFDSDVKITCRLPDAAAMKHVRATAVDLGESWELEPVRQGDTLRLTLPKHAKATVLLFQTGR